MSVDIGSDFSSKPKNHNVSLEHLDFKYVEKCDNVKELEKIYKVLVSGVEGKYPELEHFTSEKIKKLSPNSRVLRKDAPILLKESIAKDELKLLDNEINDFVKSIPKIEKKLTKVDDPFVNGNDKEENLPPIRSANQTFVIGSSAKSNQSDAVAPVPPKPKPNSNKSPKPKDYRDWEKIEKQLENELNDNVEETKKDKKPIAQVTSDKTTINESATAKKLIKNLPKHVETKDMDDNLREIKAEQEKNKGNEAFRSGFFEEALVYYTRSIEYLPAAAYYNNRALTYLKLEKWDKVVEDCDAVFKFEKDNLKALLRRSQAYLKKRNYIEAKKDIETFLKLEPSDKKAQELKNEIDLKYKIEQEAKEKVLSAGGNRLKIEETDGSEDEEEDVVIKPSQTEKIPTNNQSNLKNKKSIKITEVESDDEETDEESVKEIKPETQTSPKNEEPKQIIPEKSQTKAAEPKQETPSPSLSDKKEENIEPPKPVSSIELPASLLEFKNKGNTLFSSGQYGEAIDYYTKAIDEIKKITAKSSEDVLFIDNNLSVLYNNRASSYHSNCSYKSCINDCNTGLDLINKYQNENLSKEQEDQFKNLKLKLLLKKASSLEMMEKFEEAFSEYQTLMRLDSKFKNVQQSYNRVRNILNDTGKLNKIRSVVKESKPVTETKASEISPTKVTESKPAKPEPKPDQDKKINHENLYEEYKTKGNEFVKNNDYENACEYYTKCVELDKQNIVAYLNRSLCYIKLNKPDQAIKDCSFVLNKDKNNVKALYRRAMAHKLKVEYEWFIDDLNRLISIEPNNQIAILELQNAPALKKQAELMRKQEKIVKEVENLSVNDKKETKENNKKIEEITEEKKNEAKSENTKPLPKSNTTPSMPKPDTSASIPQSKSYNFTNITNAYEFLQAWNSINPKDITSYANLVSNVDPVNMPKFIGSKLDDTMLQALLNSIYQLRYDETSSKFLKPDRKVVDYLKNISKVQRFNVIKLFISNDQKKMINEILRDLDEAEIKNVKGLYDL